MVKKLFHENPYLKEFTSTIVEIVKKDDKFHVVLDQTAFYPEGGGQPSDTGYIEDIYVSYVYEDMDKVYHIMDMVPEKMDHVKCIINWDRRFDHMQQHLGQHILSASFHKLLGAETIGFHLGTDNVTIDITLEEVTEAQANKVEYLANQIVFNNLSVKQLYPTPEELKELPLRKPPKVHENIRIIEVDQMDFSPCGGTHPYYTGEVGMIKIKKLDKIRGTARVEFLCGNRALKDYGWKNQSINEISSLLSVKDIDVSQGVQRLSSEYSLMKKELRSLKEENLNYEAMELYREAELFKDIKVIKRVYDNRNFGELRVLAAKIVSQPNIIAILGTKSDKAQIILSCSKDISINMNDLFKEISPLINGKGGGNAKTAQGGGDDLSNLDSALQAAHTIILKRHLA